MIVSASIGPGKAYYIEDAESFVYRRSDDEEKWKAISKGLPEPSGTTITILASNSKAAGELYAVNNHGIFISTDSGVSWRGLDIQWPKEYIFRKILGHLQSDRTNSFQMCTLDSHKRLKRVGSESGRPRHPAGVGD